MIPITIVYVHSEKMYAAVMHMKMYLVDVPGARTIVNNMFNVQTCMKR